LASAKSKEEYFQVMKQLLDSEKGEFLISSSGSYTPLGDENEDDCYGILPSLQNHLKTRVFRLTCFEPIFDVFQAHFFFSPFPFLGPFF